MSQKFHHPGRLARYNDRVFSSSIPVHGGTLTGRFVRHTIDSKHLGGSRGVTVRLPDRYDPENKSYPVIYMHDGQNLFDRRSAFQGNEWHVDEAVAELTARGAMPDCVLVAIDNGPQRNAEYSHVPDPEYGGGRGKDYESFLLQELMPAVESQYAVNPRNRVMLGSSMGGLVTLAIGMAHPGLFAALGPMSSSAWWANGQIAEQILRAPLDGSPRPRIWMDMGTEEGGSDQFGQRPVRDGALGERPVGANQVQDVRDRTREAATALLHRGWVLDHDLRYHEPSWSRRLDQVLPWLTRGMSVESR
jgi:predicted alpha/beta superfamily hydrolase